MRNFGVNSKLMRLDEKIYVAPKVKTVRIANRNIICTSPTGRSNEGYEEGNTDDWFNN